MIIFAMTWFTSWLNIRASQMATKPDLKIIISSYCLKCRIQIRGKNQCLLGWKRLLIPRQPVAFFSQHGKVIMAKSPFQPRIDNFKATTKKCSMEKKPFDCDTWRQTCRAYKGKFAPCFHIAFFMIVVKCKGQILTGYRTIFPFSLLSCSQAQFLLMWTSLLPGSDHSRWYASYCRSPSHAWSAKPDIGLLADLINKWTVPQ